jgi:uncharacterized membrane protein YccC
MLPPELNTFWTGFLTALLGCSLGFLLYSLIVGLHA